MGRFYKTHTRWMASEPVKKSTPVAAAKEDSPAKEAPAVDTPKVEKVSEKEPVAVIVEKEKVEEAPAAMIIEKKETEKGTICTITTDLDCDEIRYNVGSKKVTEKNKSRCKLYEGEFVLEEPGVVNASAFKEGVLIYSVQG